MKENKGISLEVIANDINYIKKDIAEIKEKLEKDYVTRIEFEAKVGPLEKGFYGLITLVLTAVVMAVLSLVIRGKIL